jgi:microcystin-dependent protein
MVSTFTPNIQLEEPARGDDVGTWDTPVNSNMTELDLCVGGIATISAAAGSVVLAAAQLQSRMITFNSTLAASITITFKTSFVKDYLVQHIATGSSAFLITLQTTAAGGQAIALPPGEATNVFNDGTNIKFTNLGRVGTYWDYGGSSVPAWVSGCTVPPYLNCNGGTFSATTYPQLAVVLGSTTLPDARGKSRFVLDQGAGLISTAATGFSGSSVAATGGAQATTLVTGNLPAYTPSGAVGGTIAGSESAPPPAFHNQLTYGSGSVDSYTATGLAFAGNAQGGNSTPFTNLPPAYIGGLTLIRAA